MNNSNLDKKFKHHKWFKEGVTVRFALDYFAKTGFYLDKKRKSGTTVESLFSEDNYQDVLRSDDYRDRATYTLNAEEKEFFIERVEHWRNEHERQHQEWLNSEIDVEKELRIELASTIDYSLSRAEREIIYAEKDNDFERIDFWKAELELCQKKKEKIDTLINLHKYHIKTNKDFLAFKELLSTEVFEKFSA